MPKKRIDEIELHPGQDGKFVVMDEYDREDHYPVLYFQSKMGMLRLGWFDPERIGPWLEQAKQKVINRYLE